VRDRTNGKRKDPVRLPIIEDRQGHVRRRPSERDQVLVSAFTNRCSKKWKRPSQTSRFTKDYHYRKSSTNSWQTRRHRLIVLDDLMYRVVQNVDMECHHRRLSVVFITQNIFPRGTKSRTIALNTTYLVMMNNIRVATLGRQLFPGRSKILTSALSDATSLPFGRGHVTSIGRHLQTENTRVPGRGPDSVRSQPFIRGRTRDGREQTDPTSRTTRPLLKVVTHHS